jgi:hypothetical protein
MKSNEDISAINTLYSRESIHLFYLEHRGDNPENVSVQGTPLYRSKLTSQEQFNHLKKLNPNLQTTVVFDEVFVLNFFTNH